MLYHASKQTGIKELIPQMSTHGKKYVYAINNRLTALLFGAPKDDFDILVYEQMESLLFMNAIQMRLKKYTLRNPALCMNLMKTDFY